LLGPLKKSLTERGHHQLGAKKSAGGYLQELRGGLGKPKNAIGGMDAQKPQDAAWFERSMPGAYLNFGAGRGTELGPAKLAGRQESDHYKKINKSYNIQYTSPRLQKNPNSPQKLCYNPSTPRNPSKFSTLPQNPQNFDTKPNPAFKDSHKKLYFKSLHSIYNNLPETIGKVKTLTNIGINQSNYTRSSTVQRELLTTIKPQNPKPNPTQPSKNIFPF
jgi:hypothetical protein